MTVMTEREQREIKELVAPLELEVRYDQPTIVNDVANPDTSRGGFNVAGQWDPNMPAGYGTEYVSFAGPMGNQNPILPTGGNPYSGGSSVDDRVYGGLGITGLLGGNLGDALRTAGGYYAGQQGIEVHIRQE